MANQRLPAQLQTFFLAGAGIVVGDTSITLQSFLSIDGVPLTMADFGTKGYGTLEPNKKDQEEQISFTGITQNLNGTATLTGVKNVQFLTSYVETAGVFKDHFGGVRFIISNDSGYLFTMANQFNEATVHQTWTFNALSENANPKIDNINYVPVATDYITLGYINANVALTVKEVDGVPTVPNVKVIRFQNGTVTNDGGGQVTVLNSAGGGGAGGFATKPMTFALTDNDGSGSDPLTGYIDREALCYKNTTTLIFQDSTGFMQSRDVTIDWPAADTIAGFTLIGNDLYVLLQDSIGTTADVYLYDSADLSLGGTLVTFAGQALAYQVGQTMTSNGTNIFFTFDSGQSANSFDIAKFSHASNTMTYISSVTCGVVANQFNVAFGVDDSENYYGFDAGIAYQYDLAGVLTFTTGDCAYATSAIVNWTNTLYTNDSGDNIFVKLYLPDTQIDNTSGMTIRLTAEEDLTVGDTVGYTTNIDDGAIKAVWAQRPSDILSFTDANNGIYAVARLTADTYVLLFQLTPGGSSRIAAVTATLDRATMSWIYGTPLNLFNEFGKVDVVRLDNDKFAVAWFTAVTNPYTINVKVFTVAAGVITPQGSDAFSEPSTDNGNNVDLVQLGTDRFAMVIGGTQVTSHCDLFEVTVAANIPTIGTQTILDSSTQAISMITVVDTDKVAVANDTSLWIATVAAGVWTVGAPIVLPTTTGNNTNFGGMTSIATDTLFIDTGGEIRYVTIVGTVPTIIANTTYSTTSLTQSTLFTDQSEVYLYGQQSTAVVPNVNGASKLTVAGASILLSPPATFNLQNDAAIINSTSMVKHTVLLGADYYGAVQNWTGTAGDQLTFLFHVQGMTQYFIGIAQATVARGNLVNVLISGTDSHQTGLTAGILYDPFEGGLVTTGVPGVFSMTAQNSTTILLN